MTTALERIISHLPQEERLAASKKHGLAKLGKLAGSFYEDLALHLGAMTPETIRVQVDGIYDGVK